MSDLVINVRQISNYPNLPASDGTESVLVQQGGLGGPYASISTARLVATALSNGVGGPLDVGPVHPLPQTAIDSSSVFAGYFVVDAVGAVLFNAYQSGPTINAWTGGLAGAFNLDPVFGYQWQTASGQPGAPLSFSEAMRLTIAGDLKLMFGTLTVARDPNALMDVVTLNYLANNTVASFNNRIGKVTLNQADIYGALCLDSPIATQNYVNQAIKSGLENLLWTCNFVHTWNGRSGSVLLTLADITCVFYQPGQQPISPTPPLTSNDDSIATTKWATEFIENELAGAGGTIATQTWVLANTVNSFNGRRGPVTLTPADVFDVGAASLNSPNFSGTPTAPTAAVGQATGQIATTAFVQQAISANTAGVSTFNTRSGDVVLDTNDITTAGGLTNPSPNLTGAPTAPTAAPGTSTPQIANTQFVMAAVNAAVTSFNTRTGAVVLTTADITGAGGAPIVSPAFSSVPTAPTAAPGTNTVQLATCAFVTNALNTAGGVSSFNGRTGAVDLVANDVSAVGGLMNPSVNLTGVPTAPTAVTSTNTNQIATCAFVVAALAGTVTSFNTRTGAIVLTAADITNAGGAVLAGPAFTGVPTAPTAPANTNNTQLATTQFVMSAILADTTGVTSFNTRTGAVTLTAADITAAGGAPSASPQFTGTPQAPTATAGTSSTQLATCAFVQAAIASAGVASFNGRTGAVTLIANDISAAQGALLASPIFTGTPAAPTAAPGTNTTQLATCGFVAAALGATVASFNGRTGAVTLTAADLTAAGGALLSGATFTGLVSMTANGGNTQFNTVTGQAMTATGNITTAGSVNGAFLSSSGGATIQGNLVTNSQLIANGGRVLSLSNSGVASVACWSGPYGSWGMWVDAANHQVLGSTDTNGNPGTGYAWIQSDGSFHTQLACLGVGVTYVSFGVNNFAFRWDGTYVSVGVDNAVWQALQPVCDERMKADIAPSTFDGLAAVLATPLWQFRWREQREPGFPQEATGELVPIGFVAQRTKDVFPAAVVKPPDRMEPRGPLGSVGVAWTMDDRSLIAAAYDAIKRLVGQIATLRERVEATEARLAEQGA